MSIASFHDDRAAGYDDDPHHPRIARRLVAGLTAGPGLLVDVATGTGEAAFAAVQVLDARRVVAVDVSAGMLDIARTKAAERDPEGRIEWRQAPAVPLDLPGGSADALVCASALHLLGPDAPGEWARVLRPGGEVGFSIPVAADFRMSADFAAMVPDALTPPADADEAAALAGAAGFTAVRVEVTEPVSTDRPRRAFLVWATR
jgi:ubiquinone/menaquinone biosynthesis C-methylase UbiE